MKIQSLHFYQAGPLGTRTIDLTNEWTGEVEDKVLFTGPNGCGKSTLLRAVAMLWEAAGYWLDHDECLPADHPALTWFSRWTCRQGGISPDKNGKLNFEESGSFAVIVNDVENTQVEPRQLGLFFGQACILKQLQQQYSNVVWIGEVDHSSVNVFTEFFKRIPLDDSYSSWFESVSKQRQKMIVGFAATSLPNLIFMDAEERRWVVPKQNIGEFHADSPSNRWLPRYAPTDDWRGQLEASLISLKITDEPRFLHVLDEFNAFLFGKKIQPEMARGERRLRVRLDGEVEQFHTLDELSAGEHQVLIMLYQIAVWAEKGAVIMIDEPDLYLHPSLVGSFLARLANMAAELGGQLVITSHNPDVWQRFESAGRLVNLGGKHE